MFNKLLERQIRRYLKTLDPNQPELQELLLAVSQAYDHNEEDRQLVERALELSSAELSQANRSLHQANETIELKNKDLIASLEYAKLVQDSMLGRESSIREVFPQSFIFNKPRDIVSGDFFWIYSCENQVYLATVDCTGHGVPGAFMSVISYRFLNQAVRDQGLDKPADILGYLNMEINETLSTKADDPEARNALDISLVRIDRKEKWLQFSGVGQKMVVMNGPDLVELKGDNLHIGQQLDTRIRPISTQELDLKPESILYMFSDGYQDQFGGPQVKKFGGERFKRLLLSLQSLDFPEQRRMVETNFLLWKNGYEQVDDTLLIGARIS